MPQEQKKTTKPKQKSEPAKRTEEVSERGDEIEERLDQLDDLIDEALGEGQEDAEEQAQKFVDGFKQEGGE